VNSVIRSGLARIASFLPTAVATLLTSHLIISHFGVRAFDAFALVLTLINLLPLNNLGVGAAVTSAYAEDGPDSRYAHRTVLTATRVLTSSTIITATAALVITIGGWWPTLLGTSSGPNLWTGLAVIVFAASFVPGLGQSMLLGLHRNHVTIVVQTLFTPLIAALTAVVVYGGLAGHITIVLPCAALVVVNLITSVIASRSTRISWGRVLRAVPRRRRFRGVSIRSLSGPMLVITLSTPIALQSDRIVLSHVASSVQVADYSVALQLISPALALVAATAQPLFPIYTQARADGRPGPSIVMVTGLFMAAGAVAGAVIAVIANPVAHLIGSGHVEISTKLAVCGALAIITAGASYPVAMSLMYPRGARFVVWTTVVALPLNVGLSIVLGRHYGAPGPLMASILVGLFVQAFPGLIYSSRRQRQRRRAWRLREQREAQWQAPSEARHSAAPVAAVADPLDVPLVPAGPGRASDPGTAEERTPAHALAEPSEPKAADAASASEPSPTPDAPVERVEPDEPVAPRRRPRPRPHPSVPSAAVAADIVPAALQRVVE